MTCARVFVLLCLCVDWTVNAQFGSMTLNVNFDGSSNENSENIKGPCPPYTSCMAISSCPMLEDLFDFSCFSSDRYFHRLNELTCGHANSEDYVCCPSCEGDKIYKEGAEKCGQSMVRGINYNGLGAHPWVARIGFKHKDTGNVKFACSGSIISKKVVLTAAHCALAEFEDYNQVSTVVVGEWDYAKSIDCNEYFCAPPTQAIKVASVVRHPGYEQKVFRHDIALIVLKKDIKFSVTAAPVCLTSNPEVVLNERALLVGWGTLYGQTNVVSRQQLLEVPLVSLEVCDRIFGKSVTIHEGQLCAGGEEGKDACSSFGGSPLMVMRNGSYVQVGIVSFGSENCGSEGVPSVYINVAHYYKWIVDNSPS
ncbi:chymotrypsin-like protease CTRL-1 [Ostrinia furnacalis]|uniref:chymotrypsin-like protease CTRL-1 n=1 Tax=Ostrinia furnacalis TaxID=93504 RepID=UPI00103FF93D|nr:chymotrypsin-like protease CTRL-1 [Ostrinia furnacalis]